jgi:hypothetical protein
VLEQSGTLAAGTSVTVRFTVARGTAAGTPLTATFGPGGHLAVVVVA